MLNDADNDDALVPLPGQIERTNPFRPASRAARWLCGASMLVVAALGLFVHLGNYGLWGDEADTVLFARAIAESGDTSAHVGHNLYAYRQGALLREQRNRTTPPLSYFLLAPLVQLADDARFIWRVPFALAGWLIVVLAVGWLWRSDASLAGWLSVGAAGLGQVSFFLYCRQCRYYALAMLASTAVVYGYLYHRGRLGTLLGIVASGLTLLAAQYLNFAALVVVLLLDYACFQRRRYAWRSREILAVAIPLGIAALGFWWFWSDRISAGNGLLQRWTLVWWNLRDLHGCECVNLAILASSPILYLGTRDIWLLRLPLAIVAYSTVVALLSPQDASITQVADVRYLAPLLPASIALVARWCYWGMIAVDWKSLPIIALAVWTNALYLLAATLVDLPAGVAAWSSEVRRTFRCTPYEFVNELARPRPTASHAVSQWLREQLAPGQSVWVVPGEERYPLMAQAPQLVYAWQLDMPADLASSPWRDLPAIHFFGREPVDAIVAFGPFAHDPTFVGLLETLRQAGHNYQRRATIDIFWDDAIRPELFWRRFRAFDSFDRDTQAIYVYQRTQP